MEYSCQLSKGQLLCTIIPDRDINDGLFCCSGMAPMQVLYGGKAIRTIGSYTEIALPPLTANQPHLITIIYADGHLAANRAWMPLGPYLKFGTDIIPLDSGPLGVKATPQSDLGHFDGLQIIPQPSAVALDGQTIEVRNFVSDDAAIRAANDVFSRKGFNPCLAGNGPRISCVAAELSKDAYQLTISPKEITIAASNYGGRFYAGVTLMTLLQTHHGALPCGEITDTPRFDWRGQHLDTVRHFYQVDTIYELLDLMALLKLNRFHWHFADDEAFRLQIDCYPELWKQTEVCGEGQFLPGLFAGSVKSGGSYSKQEAANIIARAKQLNIEVMPEIEVPAHALALTQVFPDMRDPLDVGTETSVQGYKGNVANPAMAKTWEVYNAIATEVGALFPFSHLHLGCDELPKDTWMGSPKARDLMRAEGLTTTEDLQGWTINKLAMTVSENGQRPAAWEEAAQGCNGGIGNNAILFSWTGQGPGVQAARAGYDVVMCPAQNVYMDMAHTDDPDDWGASWAAFVSLEDTVNWDPIPEPDIADRILGVQGAFWSEFTTEDSQLWPMLIPRILGVASQAWQQDRIARKTLVQLSESYRSLFVTNT
ncbi:MAG: family 20 glycosylhydrolase [Pseudoruegeria sp.]